MIKQIRFKSNSNRNGDIKEESDVHDISFGEDREIAFSVTNYWNDRDIHGLTETSTQSQFERLKLSLNSRVSNIVPKKRQDQIKKAQGWVYEDDLLDNLIDIKVNFCSLGFNLDFTEEDAENNKSGVEINKPRKQLKELNKHLEMSDIIDSLFRDWFTTDSMILYWQVQKKEEVDSDSGLSNDIDVTEKDSFNIQSVCSLSPGDVKWDNSLGTDRLLVKVPDALRVRITEALKQRDPEKKQKMLDDLRKSGVNEKWIIAVQRGLKGKEEEYVELRNEDGEYWLIKTKERKFHGLARPSLCNVFDALEMRSMLKRGDYAAAHMMEHFIQHFKMGESITSGPRAGAKTNWAKPKDCSDFLDNFKKNSKSTRMATNHTVTIEYVYPPAEMFNTEKYKKCESRLFDWSGVVVVIVRGGDDNSKYGVGFLGIKRLVSDLVKAREKIRDILCRFFEHDTVKEDIDVPDGYSISPSFDENALKESKQLLDEIKFLVQQGIEDNRTAAKELGREPDRLKASKRKTIKENQNTKKDNEENIGCWEPVYNQFNQGFNQQEQNGARPANDGTLTGENTRTQDPTTQ